ncbi:signal protein [Streptomyces sp. JV176]|uniref:signal protein n=1 Tax=Streptomyces sp. JV176 TaxID=858630 RepID=UPI002E773966|nr:signal protein [Streptomyces sp. JV176]MEE1803588.1 signal protein [Streptomyces sp. JV176]
MKIRTVGAGLTAVMLAALVGCGTGPAQETGGASEPQGAREARLSSETLQSRWWTWASMEPEPTNPVADPNGSACERNQPQDVWFLAGTFGTHTERTCTIPDGVPLAFPLLNRFGEPADCAGFMRTAEGSAVLDGKKVAPDTYQGEPIEVRSTAGNPVTGTAGRFTTIGCGLWAQLPPLTPGQHTLKIRGRSGDFSTGVDYALTVDAG